MSLNTKMKIVCVAVAFALPVAAIAAPKAQTPLVQPTGFQCSWSDGNAASSWDDSNTNAPNPADSKYGGDLETTVLYGWSCDTEGTITSGSGTLKVETDLSRDPSAVYHYACSGAAPDGACTGTVDGGAWWASITSALDATAGANCPAGAYSTSTDGDGEGVSVSGGVKSMIPGQGNGPQNYPKTSMEPCTYDPN
ncbi:MAG: hypothetical protein KAY03_00520 [Arenimonas sp.]|nr:hypothetical protein [Arenimonas sp.]